MAASENIVYYGVYIPKIDDTEEGLVISDKQELTALLKSNKKARFKQFASEKEAKEFASCVMKMGECPSSQPVLDSSPFRSLSPQEMVELRKAIERHDLSTVKSFVNDNPRFLVSSGDTPSILQVGSRYNALHIAARFNCPEICSFILQCVSSISFMRRLYSGSSSDLHERCRILVDLYLNTPDKGVNETPLHFASKYGALEIVKILVSYDQCDKERLNKYGKTAEEIVCSRASGEASSGQNREAIVKALEQRYYVGVLRSPDGCVQATVAEPFTLDRKADIERPQDSLSLPVRVTGMAGPMTYEDATVFRKKWKTPPRKLNFMPSLVRSSVLDPEKGVERIGRNLASEQNVLWKEYWPFLDAFADLSSAEGLSLLENYLENKLKIKMAQDGKKWVTCDEFVDAADTFTVLNPSNNHQRPDSIKCDPSSSSQSVDQVLSPISALCQDFANVLKITSGDHSHCNDDLAHKTDPFFILPNHSLFSPNYSLLSLNSISTVWATKMSKALPWGPCSVLRQVNNFQKYIASCAGDRRFKRSSFSKAHAILGNSIREKLVELDASDSALKIVGDIEKSDAEESLKCAALCIFKFVNLKTDVVESCNCRLEPKVSQRYRRLDFDSDDDDEDSDESDLEYFTPPSTPPNEQTLDKEDFHEAAPSDPMPNVYLVGDEPTKVDRSVLEAIATVEIDRVAYPQIFAWKTLCEKSGANTVEQCSWDSPDRRLLTTRFMNNGNKTPSWHRNVFELPSNNKATL